MPTRIVREGLLTSEPINSLKLETELFYRRLMQVADDFGRYWANEVIIRANCYQLRLNQVTEADVKRMLTECVEAGLVAIYGGGKYLFIKKFGQQTRSKSKFPEPTENDLLIKCKSNDNQMLSLVGVEGVVVVVGEDVRKNRFDEIELRLGKLFNRPPSQAWSYAEQSNLAEISRREFVLDEMTLLEKFKATPDSFFPQSISKLLTNWNETLDRARNFQPNKPNASHRPTAPDRNAGTYNAAPLSDAAKSKVR
jgi:hypothetical protein